jgi:hypothetical protein
MKTLCGENIFSSKRENLVSRVSCIGAQNILNISFDGDPTPFFRRSLDSLLEPTYKMETIQGLLRDDGLYKHCCIC